MQGDFHPWTLLLRNVHEISVDAAENGLVSDNQDVFAPFQLHNDGLKSNDNIPVRFASKIPVVVLIFITLAEILWVLFFNLAISESVAHSRVQFIQSFPLQLLECEEACGLNCSLKR